MPLLEPNIYGLWGGKQTAKGSPVAAGAMSRRFVQVSGGFNINRDDGTENYGDIPVAGQPASSKYGSSTDWINSILGEGTPAIEATPTELAWLLWAFHGAETVAPVVGPPTAQKHTFTPQGARGHYLTFMQRVGLAVPQRLKFNDCIITRVQIEGSTANKAVRITPNILSLDPGENFATDPTTPAALPTDRPFLYTDGSGTFTIDGIAFPAWSPVFADDTVPFDLVQGDPVVTLAATAYLDSVALAQWNKIVYGTTTPAAGTKPSKNIAALGSYSFYLKAKDATGAYTGREFKLTIPGVKWTPPAAPAPNPSGGATEVALAGAMRPVAGVQPYTIDVNTNNADVAFTA
jgi:hypothetical protein